jgi:hypothetical protein
MLKFFVGNSVAFAFQNKNKISTKAFFYLLNGRALPPLNYDKEICSNRTFYIQSYLDNKNRFRLRYFTSYFKASPIDGLILATERFSAYNKTTLQKFYLETLEGLAYYG